MDNERLTRISLIAGILGVVASGAWTLFTYLQPPIPAPLEPVAVQQPTRTNPPSVVIQGQPNIIGEITAKPTPQNYAAFYGRWFTKFEYTQPGGFCRFDGLTEYFRNNDYSFRGEGKCEGTANGHTIHLVFKVLASGNWMVSDSYVTMRQRDIKTALDTVRMDGRLLPPNQLAVINQPQLSPFKNAFTAEQSMERRIIDVREKDIELEGYGLQGEPFPVFLSRQG